MTLLSLLGRLMRYFLLRPETFFLLCISLALWSYFFHTDEVKTIVKSSRDGVKMVKGKVAEMVQNERLGGLDVLEAEFSKTWEFKSHNVAGYSIQGRRDHVEDRLEVLTDLANKSHPSIFGIFDGHGGEEPTLSVAEACTMLTLKAGAVQKVVGCLQPSFHGRSISVTTFPCVYQAFYPTPQVLDQLLQSALSPIWGPRPQENSQDMWQMLRHSRINLTLAYLQDLLPGSVLKHQATPLLIQVDLFQATELETEAPAPAPALLPGAEAEKGPHLELDGTPVLFLPSLLALELAAAPSAAPDPERVPSAAPAQVPGPELDSTGPRGLLGFPPQAPVTAAESAPVPEASHPCRVTRKKQPDGKPSLMAFSPRDVAEQLTAIDAEVFKNVEPSECLGSTWGKRNRPGHENVAPTVWATVVQFNRVVKCVMTSCLGDPNVTARGRAKVLERWIEVARECRALRNISSLHAVLSALQSVPIHRLKKTWGKVSRKSYRKFKKLCDEDNSLSWELLIKSSLDEQEDGSWQKQPSKFATLLRTLQRGRKRQQQKGIVPFLGTMLTDLIMLDTAMEDYVNGNEINHEKKKKEHKVMMEIVQLQEAAENYNLEPQERFRAWFWDMEQLSEDESYSLSCQLEPRC
ncbi:ral guanine nucleotide dissociation stimulator-like [Equus caballus]|uniref:ral guanine nucleotide dissociation stimulator-like n=2 Tax=Equus TaxID=9789 RepID=UPI0038B30E00